MITVAAPATAATRVLADTERWAQWWPQHPSTGKFAVDGFDFRFFGLQNDAVFLAVTNGQRSWNISVQALNVAEGQTRLLWRSETSARHWTGRPMNLFRGRRLRGAMQQLMNSLQDFLSDPDRVYGLHISTGTSTDSFLVSSLRQTARFPTTEIIYHQIDSISAFASAHSAVVTGSPMINISPLGTGGYRVQTALPVDRLLHTDGSAFFCRRMVPGYFLIADVTGGQAMVSRGLEQMSHYLSDEQRIQMAIPFYSLLSNRQQQPDSAHWRTRIYLPVMK